MIDFEIRRGDTREIKLSLTDPVTDLRVPLAGKRIWFTAKRSTSDADVDAIIRKGTAGLPAPYNGGGITVATEVGTPTTAQPWLGGEVATVQLVAADTTAITRSVRLVWDAQIAPATGDPQTPAEWVGTLTVLADVTNAP